MVQRTDTLPRPRARVPRVPRGAEGDGSTQRDVTTRNVEELIKLYKFNSKQDSLPAKVREANDAIVMALKCLGVDVSMVK